MRRSNGRGARVLRAASTYILVAVALVAVAPGLREDAGAANKYAGEFLTHGVGARALGMGSAFVAVADDVTAGYWNPAGLADIPLGARYAQLMHSETFGDVVNYDTGAFVMNPCGWEGAVGVTIVRLAVDDIPFTDFDSNEEQIFYDAARIDWESDAETAMLLTYARNMSDRLRVGGNLKLIWKNVGEYNCYGVGFDVGGKYDLWDHVTLGLAIQDVTTTFLAWDTKEREQIMPTAKIGAAYSRPMASMDGVLTLAADADVRFENRLLADEYHAGAVTADTHYGVEFVYRDMVGVRAGLAMGQLTAGAGISLAGFTVDYAFGRHEYLDSSHRVSASYAF